MYPDANQLAQMRADMAELMQQTCTIVDRTGANVYTNVPCLVGRSKEGTADAAQELNMGINLFTLQVPSTYALKKDYRVVHAGHTYEITDVFDDITPLIQIKATMERVSA